MVTEGPVLVCFAVREEAAFFPVAQDASYRVLVTGMGASNALRAVDQALTSPPAPRLILTCGFAGGLRPGLRVGSVLYSADEESDLAARLEELGAIPARFHCSERIACHAAEKADLWSKTGADAVEMESQPIRQLARARGLPSATVRVISDAVEDDLPLDFNQLLTADFGLSYGKLAWALVRNPTKIAGLLRLQRKTRGAARKLGATLGSLLLRDRLVE